MTNEPDEANNRDDVSSLGGSIEVDGEDSQDSQEAVLNPENRQCYRSFIPIDNSKPMRSPIWKQFQIYPMRAPAGCKIFAVCKLCYTKHFNSNAHSSIWEVNYGVSKSTSKLITHFKRCLEQLNTLIFNTYIL